MKITNTSPLAILALCVITTLCANAQPQKAKPEGETPSFATAKLKNNDGLVAHWKFDEPGDNDPCADSSGNGFNGTPKTAIRRGEGKVGAHCLSLADGQVVTLPTTMPRPCAPMSISVWVKPRDPQGRQYIITYLPNKTPEQRNEYEFALHLDVGGEPRYFVWGHVVKSDKQEKWGLITKQKLPVDKWTHLVVTIGEPTGETTRPSKKPGAVNLTHTMYLNGTVVATMVLPVPPYLPNMDYAIGAKPHGEYSLKGDIDDLMVFNRTLTAQEVEALYAKQQSALKASPAK